MILLFTVLLLIFNLTFKNLNAMNPLTLELAVQMRSEYMYEGTQIKNKYEAEIVVLAAEMYKR